MHQQSYSYLFRYRPLTHVGSDKKTHLTEDQPVLEIILRRGDSEYAALALIDTGATFSLFSHGIGEVLGLNVSAGRLQRLTTLEGLLLRAYAHTVELEIAYGWSLGEMEILFAERDIPRNLLGRSDFLDRVSLGLEQRKGLIHLEKAK
jgi:hypothetical protein